MEKSEQSGLPPSSFSFAGCGFLGVYHIGVVGCLQKHIPHLLKDAKFAGASAGAIISCCIICGIPIKECVNLLLSLVTEAHKHTLRAFDPSLAIDSFLREKIEELLPSNAHELCSGRLHISVTKLMSLNFLDPANMRRNELISEFPTREALIEAVLCSSYIPVFSDSKNPILANEITIDGAFSDNLPKLDDSTILISPFAGDNQICPRDETSHWGVTTMFKMSVNRSIENVWRLMDAFFIPSACDIKDYCRKGYNDALRFLTENGLIRCPSHHEVFAYPSFEEQRDCSDCRNHVWHAHENRTVPEDHQFDSVIQQLDKAGKMSSGPDFSWTEVIKLLVIKSPLEVVRLTSLVGCQFTRGATDIIRYVDELLKEEAEAVTEAIMALIDEGEMLKTILLRTTTLSIMKVLALLCRMLGYVGSCQLFKWLKDWYCRAVEECKALQAAEKQRMSCVDGPIDVACYAGLGNVEKVTIVEESGEDVENRHTG